MPRIGRGMGPAKRPNATGNSTPAPRLVGNLPFAGSATGSSNMQSPQQPLLNILARLRRR